MSDFESDSFDDDNYDQEIIDLFHKRDSINNTSASPSYQHHQHKQEYEEIEQQAVKIGPTHHEIDYDALSTYIYPVNYAVREYQFDIVKECFYENVVCAIPTGTGKTFISSVVMMNYYRWFPKSKIIFVAPTRPLVAQQIKAAVGMTEIDSNDVAILLDKSKRNRPEIWGSKRVFFSTPQVIENDLKAGFCHPKLISLVVIDEAHRTKGNYAYNNIIQFLSRFTLSFRVLALTATPGADIVSVQEVTKNLLASKIEIRTEESPDIQKYMKHKEIDKRIVELNSEIQDIIDLLSDAIRPALEIANQKNIYEDTEPSRINAFKAMEASQRVINNPRYPEGLKWYLYFVLQMLSYVGQMLRRLKVYGIKTFFLYFENKYREFTAKYDTGKSTNKIAAEFYYNCSIKRILKEYKDKVLDDQYIGHPKLEILVEELTEFFHDSHKNDSNSRVIIFTEMRESALEIVKAIDSIGDPALLKPHIFIGQSREKEKFDDIAFREKNKPKGRGRKKKADADLEEERLEKEEDGKASKAKEKAERDARRTGLSENAQINGMTQKQQKQLIKEFKQGKYNILVATSIGEEGLDIGEVDLIVCYDATSSPIKNIQRMGRTGRKKDGKVLLLLTDIENTKFQKSMKGYEAVQEQIMEGGHIEYCRSDRIIPAQYTPVCEKKYIPEDDEFAKEDEEDEIIKRATQHMNGKPIKKKNKGSLEKKTIDTLLAKSIKKRKKQFFMPDNVETGFQNASSLIKRKGASVPLAKENEVDSSDNDDEVNNRLNKRSKKKRGSDIMNMLDLSQEEGESRSLSIVAPVKRPAHITKPAVKKIGPPMNDSDVELLSEDESSAKNGGDKESLRVSQKLQGRTNTPEQQSQRSKSGTPNLNIEIPNNRNTGAGSCENGSNSTNRSSSSDSISKNSIHHENRMLLDLSDDFSDAFSDSNTTIEPVFNGNVGSGLEKRGIQMTSNKIEAQPNKMGDKNINPNQAGAEDQSTPVKSAIKTVSIVNVTDDNDGISKDNLHAVKSQSHPKVKSPQVKQTAANESDNDDIQIERVVKKDMGKDITSMIKNAFGALEIRNNKIVANTLKRRTLGVRRRSNMTKGKNKNADVPPSQVIAPLQPELSQGSRDQELIRIMNEREQKRIKEERQRLAQLWEQSERLKKSEKEREQEMKRLFPMNFSARSGYLSQKQESELMRRFDGVTFASVPLSDPLTCLRKFNGKATESGAASTDKRIGHSNKSQRLIETHKLMKPNDFAAEGHKKLRLLVIGQKKYELKRKSG